MTGLAWTSMSESAAKLRMAGHDDLLSAKRLSEGEH